MVSTTMNQTGDGMPSSRICASWKPGGRPEIQAPPVTLISPPFRIDSMPRVTMIEGIRR